MFCVLYILFLNWEHFQFTVTLTEAAFCPVFPAGKAQSYKKALVAAFYIFLSKCLECIPKIRQTSWSVICPFSNVFKMPNPNLQMIPQGIQEKKEPNQKKNSSKWCFWEADLYIAPFALCCFSIFHHVSRLTPSFHPSYKVFAS